MKDLKMRRILHPVGHGAFFTEQFYETGTNKNVFNVVYDCGVKGNHFLLEQEIDSAFSKSDSPHVDFLFISHLDEDHVNGIQYMIRSNYVDDMTTFVLPLYKDYELAIYREMTGNDVLAIYDVINPEVFKRIIYVPVTEGDDLMRGNDYAAIDMEEGVNGIVGPLVTVNNLPGKLISQATKFSWRQIWEYIPFNLHDSTSVEFFEKVKNHPDLKISDLNVVKHIFENCCPPNVKNKTPEQEEANKKLKALKDIYNSVGTPVPNDRLININSLAVVSQAVKNVKVFFKIRLHSDGNGQELYECFLTHSYGTCTYSGDLNLSLGKDFDLFENKITTVLRGSPEFQMLQIPHHGSKTSYNKRFCCGLSGECFVNYNSENGIFDQKIIYDFFSARKELLPVTEIKSSGVMREFFVG